MSGPFKPGEKLIVIKQDGYCPDKLPIGRVLTFKSYCGSTEKCVRLEETGDDVGPWAWKFERYIPSPHFAGADEYEEILLAHLLAQELMQS